MLHEYTLQPNGKIVLCVRLRLVYYSVLEFLQPVEPNGLAVPRFDPLRFCEPHLKSGED